jgi:phosphate transport system protein
MQRQADAEFRELKRKIAAMGQLVDEAVGLSVEGLVTRDPSFFQRVHEIEERINRYHVEVDDDCLRLLATQAPLAASLRLVVAILKVNTDLERMGDQATNIAYAGEKYLKEPALESLYGIPEMCSDVRNMVVRSLEAFVTYNVTQAQDVLKLDDGVDRLNAQVARELLSKMARDPTVIDSAMRLILVSRNLERVADHATNIAEDAIFVCTGRDIRHGLGNELP